MNDTDPNTDKEAAAEAEGAALIAQGLRKGGKTSTHDRTDPVKPGENDPTRRDTHAQDEPQKPGENDDASKVRREDERQPKEESPTPTDANDTTRPKLGAGDDAKQPTIESLQKELAELRGLVNNYDSAAAAKLAQVEGTYAKARFIAERADPKVPELTELMQLILPETTDVKALHAKQERIVRIINGIARAARPQNIGGATFRDGGTPPEARRVDPNASGHTLISQGLRGER